MAKKHMDFIRKAGGQKAKKLLAVILAAGMAMTALPGETITALAQEAEGQKNVLLAEEVAGSETDMPEEDTVSGNDGQAEDVIPGGDSRTAESISGNADSDVSGNADRQQDGIQGEIPAFPGYISMPGDEEADTVVYDSSAFSAYSMLESKYVPAKGDLPLTRDQNPYGTCWAFSTISLAEIGMKKAGYVTEFPDYSELHLVYFSYRGKGLVDPLGGTEGDYNYCSDTDILNRGGSLSLSENVLINWVGAADEQKAPYKDAYNLVNSGIDQSLAFDDMAHLQNYYNINIKTNPEIVKQMVKKYGAVGVSYYADRSYFNFTTDSFYCNEEKGTNHAVTVVGWDDDYAASNFSVTPEGNGAWLVRNSWSAGSDVDDLSYYTYFWLSYYDKSLSPSAYVFDFEPADNYDHNYQYDGAMFGISYGFSSPTLSVSNVFTAGGNAEGEVLKAVGIQFAQANTGYKVQIYKNLKDASNPESGTLVEAATTSGSIECEGYYTIQLGQSVELEEGDTFAVVFTLTASGGVMAAAEYSYSGWMTTVATAKEGQSFYKSPYGSTWTDFGKAKNANLRIKAYTVNAENGAGTEVPLQSISLSGETRITQGETTTLSVSFYPANTTDDKTVIFESSDEEILKVDENGTVTGVGVGMATITATVAGTSIQDTINIESVARITGVRLEADLDKGLTLEAGDTRELKAYTEPGDTANKDIIWQVENSAIAEVSEDGLLTAKNPGTTTVTASYAIDTELKASFTLTVTKSLESISLSGEDNVMKGETISLQVEFYPADTTDDKTVIFESSDENVLKVDENGVVTGMGTGNADITATVQGTAISAKKTIQCTERIPMYRIVYHLAAGQKTEANEEEIYNNKVPYILQEPAAGKEGYTFGGWYTAEDYKTKITEIPAQTTGEVHIYAKWIARKYTVIYDSNTPEGAKVTGKMPMQVFSYGQPAALSANKYACKGYAFMGWQTADGTFYADKEKVSVRTEGAADDTVYLYAIWQQTFTVSYDTQGGNPIVDNSYTYGKAMKLPVPVKEGFTFRGWYSDSAYKKKVASITASTKGDLQLYAKWSENTYNIVFNGNGSNGGSTKKLTIKYTELAAFTANGFFKKGYEFAGWNTVKTPTEAVPGTTFEDGGKVTGLILSQQNLLPQKNGGTITLYAQWKPTTYTIDFVYNGGSGDTARMEYYYGMPKTKLPVPEKEGYTFGGWYKNENLTAAMSYITATTYGNMTLYAKWNAPYTVVFHNDARADAGLLTGTMKPLSMKSETAKALTANTYKKAGYAFVGWALTEEDARAGIVTYENKAKLFQPGMLTKTEDASGKITWVLNLYPVWRNSFTVTFHLNGGEYGTKSIAYEAGVGITAKEMTAWEKPVKKGYVFVGWYKDAALKSKVTAIAKTTAADMDLYAKWKGISYKTEYVANVPENAAVKGVMRLQTLIYGTPKALTANSYKINGYVFAGWAETPDGAVKYTDKEKITGPAEYPDNGIYTLYAVWEKQTYTITYANMDGFANPADNPAAYTVEDEELLLYNPEKLGYTFLGWYTDKACKKRITKIPAGSYGNLTLYAKWKVN